MLPLDLARLSREGTLRIQGEITPDAPLWEGTGIRLKDPLRVDLKASEATSGEIVVRGTLRGTFAQECRRCLDPVEVPLEEDVVLVYAGRERFEGEDDGDGDIRLVPDGVDVVDLEEPIREEVILIAPEYMECDPNCRGLCPRCGADLNETTCECVVEEPDPRWDTLRALKKE